MTTELERRLTDAFHEDAQRAHLTNPDKPAEEHLWLLSGTEDRASGHRWFDAGTSPTTMTVVAKPRARRSGQRWLVAAACAVLVVTGVVAVAQRPDGGPEPAATNPSTTPSSLPIETAVPLPPPEPFVGVWVSTDSDGSSQTMDIVGSGTDEYEVVVRDGFATTCSGAPATMTGTGLLETDERLVIAQAQLTCDDGTTPSIGPPPQADIANFTFDRGPGADELTDSFGVVWQRAGSNVDLDGPAASPPTSGGMWPQSTLEEVRAAQELADAGDPAYTWQLDAELAADEGPWGAEIFARFIDEELGWEEFSAASFAGYLTVDGGGQFDVVLFVRCAPGQTNPLSPLYADAPAEIRGCAPTIDKLTYETVSLSVSQPESRGPSGIWVVNRWEMLQSQYDPESLYGLLYPDYYAQFQVDQVAPPPGAEVTALLQAFLQARVDGDGAEQYLLREPTEEAAFEDTKVPLLYATSGGIPYDRSELELVRGPVWPTGWTEYKVRLFAEGETVVEQYFHVARSNGQLGLVYGYASNEIPTTENGQPVAVPQDVLGGMLTLTAPPLVPRGDGIIEIVLTASSDGRVVIGADPVPISPVRDGCAEVAIGTPLPQAADATALARSLEADPDLETTETVPVSIAGIDGLQMDVTFSEQDLCYSLWSPSRGGTGTRPQPAPAGDPTWRARLYLVDYPESAWPSDSNWRPQVLTIAVVAPETDFELALEQAAPIVESLEFRTG